MKALLIGCGNIGALYDFDSDNVHTHAKAYFKRKVEVDIVEPNINLALKISLKYGYAIKNYSEVDLTAYDIVSICIPTRLHYSYLKDALKANVKVILCEKPITDNLKELKELRSLYNSSQSNLLVNYIRRFHPNYLWLKELISSWDEDVSLINCNYYKGVLNYASHAIDIISYLTNQNISGNDILELSRSYDFFERDPTISFCGSDDNKVFTFNGITCDYPLLELIIYFKSYIVILSEGGTTVTIKQNNVTILQKNNLLENYMLPVIDYAINAVQSENKKNNFEESFKTNLLLLDLINKKNKYE